MLYSISLSSGVMIVCSTEHTQCTAGVSCDWTIMEGTHDKYGDMLLTLGACNLAGTAVILVKVVQTSVCFDNWSSDSVRQKV
jgi:hypothetical protein